MRNRARIFALVLALCAFVPAHAEWTNIAGLEKSKNWRDIAASDDFTKLAVLSVDYITVNRKTTSFGELWTSIDSGATWVNKTIVNITQDFTSISMSRDGSRLAGGTSSSVGGWYSSDFGATWVEDTVVEPALEQYSYQKFTKIRITDDGKVIAALGMSGTGYGRIFVSTDNGASFAENQTDIYRIWSDIAMSASGSNIAATDAYGTIWTSRDYGASWTTHSMGSYPYWRSVSMSADGAKIIAVSRTSTVTIIAISTDGGATFAEATLPSGIYWVQEAAWSGDGSKIILYSTEASQHILTSVDDGTTWAKQEYLPSGYLRDLVVSGDGAKVISREYDYDSKVSNITTYALCNAVPSDDPTKKDGSDGKLYCVNGGSVSGSAGSCACTSCGAGWEGTNCQTKILCGKDQYVFFNTCRDCGYNGTSEAGADSTGNGTTCDYPICGENQRVQGGWCVDCEEGYWREAGDQIANFTNTQCKPILCAENEYASEGKCVACPVGYSRQAGDNPKNVTNYKWESGNQIPVFKSTSCVACAANYHISRGSCKPCPTGLVNEAGDVGGVDTTCKAAAPCAENEYVRDHECVACPEGTVSPAGADPAGDGVNECVEENNSGASGENLTSAPAPAPSPSPGSTTDSQLIAAMEQAEASKNSMLSGITDPDTRKLATILADAALAGVTVTKLKMSIAAESSDAACDAAFTAMDIDADLGACESSAPSRRRHLTNAAFDVSVFIASETAKEKAIENLQTAGLDVTTTEEDPIAILKTIPEIEPEALQTFETDAKVYVDAKDADEFEPTASVAQQDATFALSILSALIAAAPVFA